MHPLVYEGPRMVKPPIVQIAGMLRGDRALHRHRRLGVGVEHGRADAVLPAQRGGLGRDAVAQHRHLAGALQPRRRDDREQRAACSSARQGEGQGRPAGDDAARRSRFWGSPTLSGATHDALRAYAQAPRSTPPPRLGAPAVPGARRVNALRALVVATPDYQAC